MRRSWTVKPEFMRDEGRTIGMFLGADFVAEHESGAAGIKTLLGVPHLRFPRGVEDRLMRKDPFADGFMHHLRLNRPAKRSAQQEEQFPIALLVCAARWTPPAGKLGRESLAKSMHGLELPAWELKSGENKPMLAASWNEGGFAVYASGRENVEALESIAGMFREKKATMGFDGRSKWPGASGPVFVHIDAIDDTTRKEVLEADLAAIALEERVVDSGIRKILEESGKGWYALLPAIDDTGGLRFFLNPREQNRYNHGWFSLEELKAWADDTGPIIKT